MVYQVPPNEPSRKTVNQAAIETLFDTMETLLASVTERLNDASAREERLSQLVLSWSDKANDESFPMSTRMTFLECAEGVVAIYGEAHRDPSP